MSDESPSIVAARSPQRQISRTLAGDISAAAGGNRSPARHNSHKLELPHLSHIDIPSSPKKGASGTPSNFRSNRRHKTFSSASVDRKIVVQGEAKSDESDDEDRFDDRFFIPATPTRQQQAQVVLKELADGQNRIEDQLARLSGRCAEDFDEMKATLLSLYDRAALYDSMSNENVEANPPEHCSRKVGVKVTTFRISGSDGNCSMVGIDPKESEQSVLVLPPEACGREGDSAAGSPLAHNEIVINVDSANLTGCADSDGVRCVVRLNEQVAFETTSVNGCRPQWHHTKSLSYHDEEVVEFLVMISKSGVDDVFGIAKLNLSDCGFGFNGSIELRKEAHHGEKTTPVVDAMVGSLSVSVTLTNTKLAELNPLPGISSNNLSSNNRRPLPLEPFTPFMSTMKSTKSTASRRGSLQWPSNIEIRPQLEEWFEMKNTDLEIAKFKLRSLSGSVSGPSFFNSESKYDGLRCARLPVMNPTSRKRLAYDLFSLLVLLNDMVSIPYTLAWNIPFEGWFKFASWFTCMFWLGDVACSFFTGYLEDGQVVTHWNSVALHYLKTWFWLDVPLVVVDLVCVFGNEVFAGAIWRVSRIFRFIRIISLFRVFRITTNFDNVLDRTVSEAWRSIYVVSWLIIALLWVGHIVCCFWYWLGLHGGYTPGQRWFDSLDWRDAKFISQDADYQYFTAYHWALSQISGGGVEVITPRNTYERIFNVVCIVFGVLFGTTLVSILSTTMIEIRMSQQERLSKVRAVRQYLVQNNINPNLAMRVQKNLNEHFKKEKRLSQKEVPALNHLSKFLRMELRFAIVGPHLLRHPLFNLLYKIDSDTIQTICYDIVRVTAHPPQDMVFMSGKDAEDAYYIISGRLQYNLSSTSSPLVSKSDLDEEGEEVPADTWLAWAALWTQWRYVGNAMAMVLSELLVVSAEGMLEVIMKHGSPAAVEICREYGTLFHQHVVTGPREYTTDLEIHKTNYQDMVLEMRESVRVIIGMVALSKLKKDRWLPLSGDLAKLESEVMNGKSIILENVNRDVERIVAVAVLSLTTEDERILLQVGKIAGGLRVACRMPGHSQFAGESNQGALLHFISAELAFLKDRIEFDDTLKNPEKHYDSKESGTYGIATTYIRTTYHYNLESSCPLIPPTEQLRRSGNMDFGEFSTSYSMGSLSVGARFRRTSHIRFPTNEAIFTVPSQSHTGLNIYAWVPKQDKDFYLKSSSEGQIMRWLESLDLDLAVRRNSKLGLPSMAVPSMADTGLPVNLPEASFHPFSLMEKFVGDRSEANDQQPLNPSP